MVDATPVWLYNSTIDSNKPEFKMSTAFFYVEYKNGAVIQSEFKSSALARKAYNKYSKAPEDNAKGWGWDTKYETPTLAQQIRAKKAM